MGNPDANIWLSLLATSSNNKNRKKKSAIASLRILVESLD